VPKLPDAPFLLLLTEEDLHAESLALRAGQIAGLAGLAPSRDGLSPNVAAFRNAALADGLMRAADHFGQGAPVLDAGALLDHARGLGLTNIVTAYAPVGPIASQLAAFAQQAATQGLALHYVQRAWDRAAWPLATKGFFPFRQHIPSLLPK